MFHLGMTFTVDRALTIENQSVNPCNLFVARPAELRGRGLPVSVSVLKSCTLISTQP